MTMAKYIDADQIEKAIVSEGNTYLVDDEAIYVKLPQHECLYQLLMPKEVFIEAYNKYIRDYAFNGERDNG